MRPALILLIIVSALAAVDGGLYVYSVKARTLRAGQEKALASAVAFFGLTDLCVATEARYTRHPAVTDPLSPFMDHPGAIEHFPSGSFWAPPPFFKTHGSQDSAGHPVNPKTPTEAGGV